MKDTYCGKICEECTEREKINCLGCDSKCDIAKCCIHRERENCEGCTYKSSCVILEKAPTMAAYRQKYNDIAQKAPFLRKWLSYLFWIVVPVVISSIMTNDSVANTSSAIYMVGNILSIITALIYSYILLQLSKEEFLYKSSAVCKFIDVVISVLVIIIDLKEVVIFLGIAAIVVSFVGEYKEYKAHAHLLVGIYDELAEKWNRLWLWYIGVIVAMVIGLLFMFISIALGTLVMLVSAIGIIVVSIIKLIYIYRMSEKFGEYC